MLQMNHFHTFFNSPCNRYEVHYSTLTNYNLTQGFSTTGKYLGLVSPDSIPHERAGIMLKKKKEFRYYEVKIPLFLT